MKLTILRVSHRLDNLPFSVYAIDIHRGWLLLAVFHRLLPFMDFLTIFSATESEVLLC